MRTHVVLGLCLLALALVCAWYPQTARTADQAPYVIGAVLDMTGPGSPLGTPEANTLKMMEKQINANGGIHGHPVKVIIYDNASDEAKSVTSVKKLIESDKVLAIIGSSQTGTTLAAAATVEEGQTPMISCASGIKIVDPVKPWIFKVAQSDVHAVGRILAYLKSIKASRVALLSVANPFGDSGKQQLELQAPKAKIQIVAEESFGATDTDMTAQLMKIRRTNAQAIICYGTNPGPAIVAKNAKTLGIQLPIIMSHGIANRKFIELAGDAANGIVFPASKIIVAGEIPVLDKQKKVLTSFKKVYEAEYPDAEADTFAGHAYDAFNLVVNAIKKVGPNRTKIRAELEKAQFVGISGVFKFTAADHNGLGWDSFAIVRIVNGVWKMEKGK